VAVFYLRNRCSCKHFANYEKVDFDNAIAQMQAQMAEVKELLREDRERSDKLRRQC